ncbi:MAG: S41 family peptidase, partial [Candidatus Kapaibacteriota bacterium]
SAIKECILLYKDDEAKTENNFIKILEKLVAHSKDNFTRILHKDYISDKSFPFLWKYIDGNVYITKIGENVDTIEVGDKVIALELIPIERVIDSISKFVGFSSDNWKILKSLAYIRNFFPNDTLKLTLMKSNGKIVNKTVYKDFESNQIYEDRPEKFQLLNNKIAYFDLTRLVDKEIKDILDTLSNKDYFIFDLRGIALTSEQFLSLFTDKTIECNAWKIPVFAFPFKQKISWQTIRLKINGKSLFNPKGIYFLIDERTIGLAELIADVAKRFKIGTLVGSTTGGNPMEFSSKIFPNGLTLYFSVLRVFSCDGEDKYRKGIVPNIPVKIRPNKDSLLRDQILDKVISLINSDQ